MPFCVFFIHYGVHKIWYFKTISLVNNWRFWLLHKWISVFHVFYLSTFCCLILYLLETYFRMLMATCHATISFFFFKVGLDMLRMSRESRNIFQILLIVHCILSGYILKWRVQQIGGELGFNYSLVKTSRFSCILSLDWV